MGRVLADVLIVEEIYLTKDTMYINISNEVRKLQCPSYLWSAPSAVSDVTAVRKRYEALERGLAFAA